MADVKPGTAQGGVQGDGQAREDSNYSLVVVREEILQPNLVNRIVEFKQLLFYFFKLF